MTDPIHVLMVDDQQLLHRKPARLLVKLTTVLRKRWSDWVATRLIWSAEVVSTDGATANRGDHALSHFVLIISSCRGTTA